MALCDRLARCNRWLPNPMVRSFAGRRRSPVAVVVHRGRRSGRRRTPVLAFRVDDGYAVVLLSGADRDSVRKVLAAGCCTLKRGGRRVELTAPRMLDGMALVSAPMRPVLWLLRVPWVLRLWATERCGPYSPRGGGRVVPPANRARDPRWLASLDVEAEPPRPAWPIKNMIGGQVLEGPVPLPRR